MSFRFSYFSFVDKINEVDKNNEVDNIEDVSFF